MTPLGPPQAATALMVILALAVVAARASDVVRGLEPPGASAANTAPGEP